MDWRNWTIVDCHGTLEGALDEPDLCRYVVSGEAPEGRFLQMQRVVSGDSLVPGGFAPRIPDRRPDVGICPHGEPLPADLNGLATFLINRSENAVSVTTGEPLEQFTFDQLKVK
jgi:hypothetical protein